MLEQHAVSRKLGFYRWLPGAALALFVGCATSTPASSTPSPTHSGYPQKAAPIDGGPSEVRRWEAGPETRDAGALVHWLETNARDPSGARRLFHIPVVFSFEEPYRLQFRAAFHGDPAQTALQLDDGALGISLSERLRQYCPRREPECALWLDAHWGPLIEGARDTSKDASPILAVRNVGTRIELSAGNDMRAFVEISGRSELMTRQRVD